MISKLFLNLINAIKQMVKSFVNQIQRFDFLNRDSIEISINCFYGLTTLKSRQISFLIFEWSF